MSKSISWSELIRTMENIDCSCGKNYNKVGDSVCPNCGK